MNSSLTARRLAASTLVAGLAVAPQLVASSAHADTDCSYAAPATSQTTLSVNPASPTVGSACVVTASVTTAGTAVTGGTVTFGYAGTTQSAAVSAGSASATFTAVSTPSDVTATFNGQCASGSASIGVSTQSVPLPPAPTVGGVQEEVPPVKQPQAGTPGRAPEVAGVSATTPQAAPGALPATGADASTELWAVGGAGLLLAGTATLLVRRRRQHA